MTDSTIEQLNDAVNNTHISQDTTNDEQHGSNYLKNKKKRDKAKLKKQQQTDTQHNGHHSATNDNSSTNNDNTNSNNIDLESSLLMNDYFKHYSKSLTLTHTSQYNRSTLSNTTIQPGTVLYQCKSYISIVNDTVVSQLCHTCLNTSTTPLLYCRNCNFTRYCSTQCQNKLNEIHTLECNALKQLSVMKNQQQISGETAPIRGVIRWLYKLYQANNKPNLSNKINKHRITEQRATVPYDELGRHPYEAETLQSNANKLDAQLVIQTKLVLEKLSQIIESTVWQGIDVAYRIYMQLRCNAHQITSKHTKQHLGYALYLPAAMQNHSCLPNCVYTITDKDKQLSMRTISTVQPNTELTYAYTNMYEKRSARHNYLKQMYYIDQCQCDRCTVPLEQSNDRYIEGYTCSKCDKSDVLNDILYKMDTSTYVCQKCKTEYNKTDFDKIEQTCSTLFNNAMKLYQANQNVQQLITTIETTILPKLLQIVHIYNVSIFNLRVFIVSIYGQVSQPHLAIPHIQYCIDAMKLQQLYNHPELGAMYDQLVAAETTCMTSDADRVDQHKQNAIEAAKEAVKIFTVCLGEKHELTKQSKKSLAELTK